jgi:hypothetical protein
MHNCITSNVSGQNRDHMTVGGTSRKNPGGFMQ